MYTCEVCSANFEYKGSYTDHLKRHNNSKIYECAQCPCFFKNAGHLHVHIKEVHEHNKKTYNCTTCKKIFTTRHLLVRHRQKEHNTVTSVFNCKFCNKTYCSKNALKWHLSLNHNKDFQRSKCPYCPSDFKWPHHLKLHIRKAHINKGDTPVDLIKRGLTTFRRKTNSCVVCSEKFEQKFDLMLHLRNVHKQEIDIYKCCLCDACFTLSSSLENHIKEHKKKKTGQINHSCVQCFPEVNPQLYEPIKLVDNRTDIQKEIVDFELSLMEYEDIREMIKSRIRDKYYKKPTRNIDKENGKIVVNTRNNIKENGDVNTQLDLREKIDPKSKLIKTKLNKKKNLADTYKENKYTCPLCKDNFHSSYLYANHVKLKHGKLNKDNSQKKVKRYKFYECGKCNLFFESKLFLLRHISDVHMALSIVSRSNN